MPVILKLAVGASTEFSSKTHISSHAQHEDPNDDDSNIQTEAPDPSEPPPLDPARAVVGIAHAQIGHAPEDEAEKGVEERAHQRQQVGKERNDLGDDERYDPRDGQDAGPRSPPDNGVVALVPGSFKDAEKEEASGDGGVEHTQEDEGRDHEGERHLEVRLVAKRSECRSCVVLRASVRIDNGSGQAEDDDFGNRHRP